MPGLTRKQVREVDRIAIEEYGIPGVVLMENAARGVADVAVAMLAGAAGPRVLIVCGGGNNGGDGFAVARHLHVRGVAVVVVETADPGTLPPDAQVNRDILGRIGSIPVVAAGGAPAFEGFTLIVDALLGTGATSPPRPAADELIRRMNAAGRPILAIDLPSGLDCDAGRPLGDACVWATKTVTFVAEKAGFASPESRAYTGEVVVADIGAPPEVVARAL